MGITAQLGELSHLREICLERGAAVGPGCGGSVAGTAAAMGNPWGGSTQAAGDSPRRLNHGAGAGGCAGTSGAWHWTRVDLARRGGGASRANGDRGVTRRAGAPAGNPFGDR